jgi:hypothetical protein
VTSARSLSSSQFIYIEETLLTTPKFKPRKFWDQGLNVWIGQQEPYMNEETPPFSKSSCQLASAALLKYSLFTATTVTHTEYRDRLENLLYAFPFFVFGVSLCDFAA